MRNENGLTLLELAVGLMILGLLITPVIASYNLYIKEQQKVDSDGHIQSVQSALQKYVTRNGRYPLPAARTARMGSAGYGQQFAGVFIACAPNINQPCRTDGYRDTVADPDTDNDKVLIGDVPSAELGLPADLTIDGYGNKLTYAVSEYLTNAATFQEDRGVIKIHDAASAMTDRTGTSSDVHYLVFSHGQNGKGAFNINGIMVSACNAPGVDVENCDNDALFTDNFTFSASNAVVTGGNVVAQTRYQRQQSLVAGNTNYDDFLRFVTNSASDLWARTASAMNSDLFSTAPGNARIGAGPVPSAKLHVMGDVLATANVQARRLCTATGGCIAEGSGAGLANPNITPNIFSPASIGGTPLVADAGKPGGGIRCSAGSGLSGISKGDELCGYAVLPVTVVFTNCAPGTFAVGTNSSGDIICEPPPVTTTTTTTTNTNPRVIPTDIDGTNTGSVTPLGSIPRGGGG